MTRYTQQWQEYRRRHWAAVFGLVVGLPAAFAISLALREFGGLPGGLSLCVVVLLWALAWGWLGFRVARFPCPRCGAALASGHWCRQCGLRLYEQA